MSDNPFNIIGDNAPKVQGVEVRPDEVNGELNERIKGIIDSSKIVLFMKGNPGFPQCGFSANTVAILQTFDVPFNTFDILQDMDIRQGLKDYSNWPTFPQLYVGGELIGGNDIITELYQNGELADILK
jgi:monothiol glutaredoxin